MSYLYIYIFPVIFQDFVNVTYWQTLFRYELRLQETPGTISRSALKESQPGKAYSTFKSMGAQPGDSTDNNTFTLPNHSNLSDQEIASVDDVLYEHPLI